RGASSVARREGSADGALPADCRRDHSHRAAAGFARAVRIARRSAEGVRVSGRDRFAAFVERKQDEAVRARLHPFVSDAWREPTGVIPIANAWTEGLFAGRFYLSPPPRDLPATSLVFVQSRDGNTGAADPGALGGGETDKHVVYEGLSRAAADAVLAGAETIRGGDVVFSVWHPEIVRLRRALGKPRHPVQIVATLRGLSFDALIYNVPDLRVVLLTVSSCTDLMNDELAARPWITPIVMRHASQLARAFGELRRLGIERVSAVGGRTVAAALIDAGLVQDLYLTTSPRPGGRPDTPLYAGPLHKRLVVRKRGTADDSGVVFEHFLVSRDA